MEFRGFVTNGKLNALSQYNHLAFFPKLLELKQTIQEKILDFFNKNISDRLKDKFPQYIIDFALVGSDLSTIYIIELNPFLPSTDGALFSWQKERHLLENGPFEFRVRENKASGAKSLLSVAWRDVLQEENVTD